MVTSDLNMLSKILADPNLNELMFNGHQHVFVERGGRLQPVPSPFKDEREFEQMLITLSDLPNTVKIGRLQLDGMMPDGCRFHITRPPQSPDYATLSIRKFVPMHRGLENLVGTGALSKKAAQFLEACVRARLNILTSGPGRAGKAEGLKGPWLEGRLGEPIKRNEGNSRIPLEHPKWVRPGGSPDERGGTLRDCLVGSLRMRPDRIVVGE